jgi:hypothetical protein
MVITELTREVIDEGRRLVLELDASGLDVQAAVWFHRLNRIAWRLILEIPELEVGEIRHGLGKIREALQRMGAKWIEIPDVSLGAWGPYPLDDLRTVIETGRELREIRVTETAPKGRWVPDALIYRLLPATHPVSK